MEKWQYFREEKIKLGDVDGTHFESRFSSLQMLPPHIQSLRVSIDQKEKVDY